MYYVGCILASPHLANTIEPSMCGDGVAFLSNYFDHLLLLGRIAPTTYVDAAYCYRPSSVVCRLICHTSEPCKNG